MLPSLGAEPDLGAGVISGLAHCLMKSPALQNECVNPFSTQQTPGRPPSSLDGRSMGGNVSLCALADVTNQSQHFCMEPGASPEPFTTEFPLQSKPINQSRSLVGVFVSVLSCQVPELRNRQMARLLGSQQSHNSRNACFHTIFHGRQHITALPCFGSPNLSCPNLPMLISSFKREKQELDSKSYRK